jgi:hypothetical protein
MEQRKFQHVRFSDKISFNSDEEHVQRRPYRQHIVVAKGVALAMVLYLCWSYFLVPLHLSRGGRLPSSQSADLVDFDNVIPPLDSFKKHD